MDVAFLKGEVESSDEYTRKVVCHSKGEHALGLNGDGKNGYHVNTQEGIWSIQNA